MLSRSGIDTGTDLSRLIDIGRWLQTQRGKTVQVESRRPIDSKSISDLGPLAEVYLSFHSALRAAVTPRLWVVPPRLWRSSRAIQLSSIVLPRIHSGHRALKALTQ